MVKYTWNIVTDKENKIRITDSKMSCHDVGHIDSLRVWKAQMFIKSTQAGLIIFPAGVFALSTRITKHLFNISV